MKILAFTRYGRKGASSRVRWLQFVPILEQSGYRINVSSLLSDLYVEGIYRSGRRRKYEIIKGYACRLVMLLFVRNYDVIWIEKELFPGLPAWGERLLRWIGVRYVVDYDDAVFHNYDLAKSGFVRHFLGRKIAVVMKCSSCVVAGNNYIATYARKTGASNVQVIPSVVDTVKYHPAMRSKKETLVVGWMGTPVTVKYLAGVAPALLAVQKQIPFVLRVVGAKFNYPGLQNESLEWSEESEVELIQQFDVGIMPLDDTPWERGKCGYKLIQYMACGVPVVASPVGINAEIVDDLCGFVAKSQDEWAGFLLRLLQDCDSRIVMGEESRKRVMACYSQNNAMAIMADKVLKG